MTIIPTPTIDGTRKQYAVKLDGVKVGAEDGFGGDGSLDLAHSRAFTAVAAEMVGVAQRGLEMAVEYAKDRKQFGRPIGSYQAVSHKCAQMLLETEGARSAAYYAAWAADNEPDKAALAASMAKAYAPTPAARDGLLPAGARRHRLHLGARPAPVAQAGQLRRRLPRRRALAPGRAWPKLAGSSALPLRPQPAAA